MLLQNTVIYPIGTTEACRYAVSILRNQGFSLTDHPAPEITHLLMDVPSFRRDGQLRCGSDISRILSMLPQNITLIGGNLDHPALKDYRKLDLLQDEYYLAQNADITADCALRVAAPLSKLAFRDTSALVIGWGRIGKCLARLLRNTGCAVTVAARKDSDLAMLQALGYSSIPVCAIPCHFSRFQLMFNTVPQLILSEQQLSKATDCIMIELASETGLDSKDVIIARGLPGTYAPKSSGALIADTFVRLWKEKQL